MISYDAFWDTLKTSKESTYSLIKNHHISSSTIDKLRKNKPLNTTTINDLCRARHYDIYPLERRSNTIAANPTPDDSPYITRIPGNYRF